MKSVKLKIFLICIILCLPVMAMADPYTTAPPMPDKYLLPDGSIQTFSGVEFAPANAGRAIIYKQSPWAIAKWLLPDGSIVAALPFSGGTGSGDVSTSGTPTQYNWAEWTNATTIKGTAVTASKPVCTDANGSPTACAGTEGVWQAAGSYQPTNATLTAIAGLTSAANAIPYFTGSETAGVISSSADMVSLLGSADYATARTNMGTWGVSGSITDEQLVCGETTGGTNLLKSCGAKITYTEPVTNTTICRTGVTTTGACTNPIKLASFAWDGAGSAVATANSKRCIVIPTTATVTGIYAIADASTTTHIHVYQDAFATGARSTTVTGTVDIGATLGALDTTLTSWDKSITAGDEICMSVEANDNAKWLNVIVYGTY